MPNVTPTAARDTVAPTLQKAQETLTETVLPAVRDALAVAAAKTGDLLDSDAALEAKRRSLAVLHAAKGQPVVTPAAKRWRFGLGMIAVGTGIGFGVSYLFKRLATPVESYQHTMPVPSGTDGGTAVTETVTDDIDLRAGAPTTS